MSDFEKIVHKNYNQLMLEIRTKAALADKFLAVCEKKIDLEIIFALYDEYAEKLEEIEKGYIKHEAN
jgi:hypothetical protein